jgi:hypothetical protein
MQGSHRLSTVSVSPKAEIRNLPYPGPQVPTFTCSQSFSNLNGQMLLPQSPASSASPRLERSARDPQFPGLEACLRRPRCGAPATRA